MKDTNSLSHTSYRCKYHIVIVPKYRRTVFYDRKSDYSAEVDQSLMIRFIKMKILHATG